MVEKKPEEKPTPKKNYKSPWRKRRLTIGQWAADKLSEIAGSWGFIAGFTIVLIVWITLNTYLILFGVFDKPPYILLNLFLSCLAAIQAPVILMSQNRAAQRDRAQIAKDYYIDRKAEKEIKVLQMQVLELKEILSKQSLETETKKIEGEIKNIQADLENMGKTLQIK